MDWPRDRVLEQSRLWVSPWRPADSVPVASTDFEMYRVGREATLVNSRAQGADGRLLIEGAARAAAQSGATSLLITIGVDYPGTRPTIEELRSRGAEEVGVDDVLAIETSATDGIEVHSGVDVVEVTTAAQVVQFERTSARGWGYPAPTVEFLERAQERLTPGWFLAHCDEQPSGTGGFRLVGEVARLWGASVVPDMRGRGVHQTLVAHRLRIATARGATLALVHAAPSSSPILQHLGFRRFGERRTYRLIV